MTDPSDKTKELDFMNNMHEQMDVTTGLSHHEPVGINPPPIEPLSEGQSSAKDDSSKRSTSFEEDFFCLLVDNSTETIQKEIIELAQKGDAKYEHLSTKLNGFMKKTSSSLESILKILTEPKTPPVVHSPNDHSHVVAPPSPIVRPTVKPHNPSNPGPSKVPYRIPFVSKRLAHDGSSSSTRPTLSSSSKRPSYDGPSSSKRFKQTSHTVPSHSRNSHTTNLYGVRCAFCRSPNHYSKSCDSKISITTKHDILHNDSRCGVCFKMFSQHPNGESCEAPECARGCRDEFDDPEHHPDWACPLNPCNRD